MTKNKPNERFLAINLPLQVIQLIIISVNTYGQKIIEIENENEKIKNKDKWNYCHHMPIFPFLGANNCLPLLYITKRLFGLKKKKRTY